MGVLGRIFGLLRRLLGLGGDLDFGWKVLTQYLLPSGVGAGLATYLLGWGLNFVEWVGGLPLLLRGGFYVCVFLLAFVALSRSIATLRMAPQPDAPPGAVTQERWRKEDLLKEYFDRIEPLVFDEDKPLSGLAPEHPRRETVRARTREVLHRLDPDDKRRVFLFLREKVMRKDPAGDFPIVSFSGADFSGIDLSSPRGRGLYETYLFGADLSNADLTRVQFCEWWLDNPGEDRYKLVEGKGSAVPGTPMSSSELPSCDFSGAILKRASLGGCDLWAANFESADLGLADLRGANLELASNLTQEQIEKAYGSHGHERVKDTKLPEYLEVPKAWNKSIDEQKRERGDG